MPFGIMDVPARQAREPMALDLARGGHIVVAGAARTGRSTVLRTIAGSIAARESASDVHIYAIDCGTGSLLPLAGLPHCGAVVTRDQTDRVERLIGKLRGEIGRRQQLLAASGFASLAEQRASAADPARAAAVDGAAARLVGRVLRGVREVRLRAGWSTRCSSCCARAPPSACARSSRPTGWR